MTWQEVTKIEFDWRKVRFRGIYKSLQYAYSVAASVNLYLHRGTLLEKLTKLATG